jgi:hypothetical protein
MREGSVRKYLRWGSFLAALGGLAWWLRTKRTRNVDPHSLGRVSDQWFMDNKHQL